jgi:hypothetical protein
MATHWRPQRLQIVWWGFPPEHWVNLKNGNSMNFLKPARDALLPKLDMTSKEAFIAGKLVDD